MDYKAIYNKWLEDERFDEETKKDLLRIKDDEAFTLSWDFSGSRY